MKTDQREAYQSSKFGVICRLKHENPSRIAEVRRNKVQRKSILRSHIQQQQQQ